MDQNTTDFNNKAWEEVAHLSSLAFGRSFNEFQLQYWTDLYRDGLSFHCLARIFASVPAFGDCFAGLDDPSYIKALYTNLSLPVDAREFDRWVGLLEKGSSREQIFVDFSRSHLNR